MNAQSRPPRRRLNVTVDPDLVDEAKSLGVNISRIVEAGLRDAVRTAKGAAWVEENRMALESNVDWIERHGIPLAEYRHF